MDKTKNKRTVKNKTHKLLKTKKFAVIELKNAPAQKTRKRVPKPVEPNLITEKDVLKPKKNNDKTKNKRTIKNKTHKLVKTKKFEVIEFKNAPVQKIQKIKKPAAKTVKPNLIIESSSSPKQVKPNLIIESSSSPKKIIETNLLKTKTSNNKMPENKAQRLNEKFIDLMEQLNTITTKQGEPFKARAYQKAQETIMAYPNDIYNPEQLKGLPGIGATIMEKLKEYYETGTLKIIEREKNNPVNVLADIYGVGPKKATELVSKGITSISQLREKQDELLNDTQKVGLKYYEDILKRIPREEIDQYNQIFTNVFKQVQNFEDDTFEIVGSYRRGAANSGDIDVIFTSKNPTFFKNFIDKLLEQKIIVSVLSRGSSKCLVITKLTPTSIARRVDFLYSTPEEFPFSILYFTGSKTFNTVMRHQALQLGFTMNEHGMYKMIDKKKNEKVEHVFKTEKDIFDFLNMQYKTPQERIDGRSVVIQTQTEKKTVSPKTPYVPSLVTKSLKPDSPEIILNKMEKEEPQVVHIIQQFKKQGIHVLDNLTEKQLNHIITEANDAYYNDNPLMTDNQFDIVKEYIEKKFPQNTVIHQIGAPVEKSKVKLPYEMASMDKIKPDTDVLNNWIQKYNGPYVISCKLDGVSGMYTTEGDKPKLYTRGDGKVGQDISHLIPHLKLPKNKDIVIRGEFIIPKEVFKEKYALTFSNPRNMVAGIINHKTIDAKIKDIQFVAYEVIKPELKPSKQMEYLSGLNVETVLNQTVKNISNELLSSILLDWREKYIFEIDGIIVSDDKIYPRKSGNPEHAFAFKMLLTDQIAEAKVVDVIWTPSKDGYLKPRVQIEPIHLGGVQIEYATGFNAAFIENNKIGIGAIIQIVRSGDVIPHIKSVTVPAEEGKMPDVPYDWNNTKIDIILKNIEDNLTVREKNISGFFKGIEVEGLSSGNVSKIINAGFDTVPKIIKMNMDDFLTIPGFKNKMATKIHDGIQERLQSVSLLTLMSSSNIFGRGISEKKFELIFEDIPDIMVSNKNKEKLIEDVIKVKGMARKTAEAFVEKIPAFLDFLKEIGLEYKLQQKITSTLVTVLQDHPLYKKTVVFTGFRDNELQTKLKNVGAVIGSSVSKNTFAVLTKDKDDKTGKILDAIKLDVPVMTPEEFTEKYL